MTETKPEAKTSKLSKQQLFDNFLFQFAPCFTWILVVGWTLILWYKAKSRWQPKHPDERFHFEFPKVMTVVSIGHQHVTIKNMLRKNYHVNYLFLNYKWKIIEGTICLEGYYLVAKNMYDKVDSILHNSGIRSGLWMCEHQPGNLRHVQFKPHAQAKQAHVVKLKSIQAKAKLGKTYK